jgi:ADP-heptose:LPS heptosyltransferase
VSSSYITLNISSENNQTPYKTGSAPNWVSLIKMLRKKYPTLNIVILGDSNETGFNQYLDDLDKSVISLIGKTTIQDALNILSRSVFFIGLDIGTMQMAIACNIPTFTIWGGSNPELYSYSFFDKKRYRVIKTFIKLPTM